MVRDNIRTICIILYDLHAVYFILSNHQRNERERERFKTKEQFRSLDGIDDVMVDENLREGTKDETTHNARGEKRSRGAPVPLYISRPSSGRQVDSVHTLSILSTFFFTVRETPSTRAHTTWHRHLFMLTQYLLGRIGDSSVRSFVRLANLFRESSLSFPRLSLSSPKRREKRLTVLRETHPLLSRIKMRIGHATYYFLFAPLRYSGCTRRSFR